EGAGLIARSAAPGAPGVVRGAPPIPSPTGREPRTVWALRRAGGAGPVGRPVGAGDDRPGPGGRPAGPEAVVGGGRGARVARRCGHGLEPVVAPAPLRRRRARPRH